MRDKLYEEQIQRHQQKMLRILREYSAKSLDDWEETDYLSIERALQVLIESLIGFARYTLEQSHQVKVSRSREAFDELKQRQNLSHENHKKVMRLIGFRNILVHDYLNLDDDIIEAIVIKKEYELIEDIIGILDQLLVKAEERTAI
ncbi:MAG: hypothetical protein COB67_09785 [SAR324 cluster bacterium]|uniref:DUF86 domain-containing protein n=1 Tax=SAR324 cluster bacterium TaxID=2024889 RepID=A0A2A4T194_9DELT|nr:MAG: hypothetical protein COB67_09785 [SAR324 cluster bacterium]